MTRQRAQSLMLAARSPLKVAAVLQSSEAAIQTECVNILFIAMEYPPVNTTGVFRSLKFSKYLREFGINPVVLTLEVLDAAQIFGAHVDAKLNAELPNELEIIRVPCKVAVPYHASRIRRFFDIYFSVEDSIGKRWHRQLWQRIPALLKEYEPRAVYVSLPPFSGGRLAVAIARRLRVPLIVDMRDGWSNWRVGPFASWLHYRLTLKRERAIFQSAAIVIAATRQLAEVFARSHKNLPKSRIQVINNGYDGDLELPATIDVRLRASSSTIVIGYVGSFYYDPDQWLAHFTPWWKKKLHRKLQYSAVKEDWLYRSPFYFFRALSQLFTWRPEFRSRVRFEVMGTKVPWLEKMALDFDLAANCAFHPRSSHNEVLRFQERCDAFLCTSAKAPEGEDYAIASKTFEHLRYAKPIIGFVTKGAQRDFLARSGLGLIADPDDSEAGSRLLEQIVIGGFCLTPNTSFLAGFHRKELTRQLATVIKRAVT